MAETVLSVRDICKNFGALRASDHVTLNLRRGEIHALIGPNGAGKSTLIEQICGTLKPESGKILIAGQDVTQLQTADRVRLGLARTFQISALALEDTVLQNVLLGAIGAQGSPYRFFRNVTANRQLREVAELALQRVGLLERAEMLAAELSHGEKRQLEVAVALTLRPRLFLMDEPMAGLGASGAAKMTAFLRSLCHEAPILLIEHDMDIVFAIADRISVLVYGKIIATGTAKDVRAVAAVREAYLGDDGWGDNF
ncbi:MAG: ABC transporter ATP-binding protein [Rhodobacteraceae bacterium]|nr:ABC transporter ATP-binding protein [Paracoccaceae bacterium]MCY4326497.1 ABC transporter ATP-binding protein [Paracoccaceae bacterium]